MRIIHLNKTSYNSVLKLAKEILADGGIVAGPSDTVYGLYCKASDDAALKKIFEMKNRSKEKALPIFVKDIKMAQNYAEIPEKAVLFLKKIWPGPVTVVLRTTARTNADLTRTDAEITRTNAEGTRTYADRTHLRQGYSEASADRVSLSKILTGGRDTIAMRIPDNKFLLDLLSELLEPLAQTSANISGKEPARNIDEISHYFKDSKIKPELVIDTGEIRGISSTVIDLTQFDKKGEWKILREGAVSRKEIQSILEKLF